MKSLIGAFLLVVVSFSCSSPDPYEGTYKLDIKPINEEFEQNARLGVISFTDIRYRFFGDSVGITTQLGNKPSEEIIFQWKINGDSMEISRPNELEKYYIQLIEKDRIILRTKNLRFNLVRID